MAEGKRCLGDECGAIGDAVTTYEVTYPDKVVREVSWCKTHDHLAPVIDKAPRRVVKRRPRRKVAGGPVVVHREDLPPPPK